jgi:hypothetical protein
MEKINKNHFNNPVVIILFLILLGIGGYFLLSKNQNENNIYYFPQGSFSAYFPQQPTFKTDTQKLLSGEKSVIDNDYLLNDSDGNNELTATYVSSAFKNSNTPEQNLSNEVAYTVSNAGGSLISSNATTYNGLPAVNYIGCSTKSYPFQSVSGVTTHQWCITGRDILKDNYLYMLDYQYKSGEEDKTLENKFLDSLVFGEQPTGSIVVIPTTDNTTSTPSQTTATTTTTNTTTQPSVTKLAPTVPLPVVNNTPAPSANTSIVPGCTSTDGYSSTNGASCGGTRIAQIVSKWSPNVALILCNFSDGTADFGSGFLYNSPNYGILVYTNKHVLLNETTGLATTSCSVQIPGDTQYYTVNNTFTTNNDPINGSLDGTDWGSIEISNGDGALNETAISAGKNLTICQKKEQTGDNVIILGYPDYAGQFTNPTATEGIISGYASPYYTTSAQIESGNSGGVAIDPDKDCYIGIPSAVKIGNYANLGRILNANTLFKLNY